ncbi:hypothetical protein SAMN05444146_4817 [Flavobacterium johnsoniae]|nr:hypothetical protein SAMN05444146_4817 [Flavobacterium johnsoniae]
MTLFPLSLALDYKRLTLMNIFFSPRFSRFVILSEVEGSQVTP